MAAQCGYDQYFIPQPIGSIQESCVPCGNAKYTNLFSLGTQATKCLGCADIYTSKDASTGDIRKFFYDVYCSDYLVAPVQPPSPPPLVVVEEPTPEPIIQPTPTPVEDPPAPTPPAKDGEET